MDQDNQGYAFMAPWLEKFKQTTTQTTPSQIVKLVHNEPTFALACDISHEDIYSHYNTQYKHVRHSSNVYEAVSLGDGLLLLMYMQHKPHSTAFWYIAYVIGYSTWAYVKDKKSKIA